MMRTEETQRIEEYLERKARRIDYELYRFRFRGGDKRSVLNRLKEYQNGDGGFGNAIEPDLRLPQSTAVATWMAFKFIEEVDPAEMDPILQGGLRYLITTYDRERNGWAIVRPEVDEYPHAPWWDYKVAMNHFGWGNPSAEILAFLIRYHHLVDAEEIIDALTTTALERIREVDPTSFHEVFNFKALYDRANSELKMPLRNPLTRLIRKSVSTSPDQWKSYVATPLKFVTSPDDPLIDLFEDGLIRKNLEFLVDEIIDGDHWEPDWHWSGNYVEAWETAKREWSGHLTVTNMTILRNFGVVA